MHLRILIALILFTPCTSAHDLWLIPPEKAKAKEPLKVLAVSGGAFPKGDHAPDPAKFAKRRLVHSDGNETALEAGGTEDLAGLLPFTPATDGVYIVGVETTPKLITLDADKFNAYLVSDACRTSTPCGPRRNPSISRAGSAIRNRRKRWCEWVTEKSATRAAKSVCPSKLSPSTIRSSAKSATR